MGKVQKWLQLSQLYDMSILKDKVCSQITHRDSQKWNGWLSLLWVCAPSCAVRPCGIVLTHCNRFATDSISARAVIFNTRQTLCVLLNKQKKSRGTTSDGTGMYYLGILKRFMSAGKGSLNGLGHRVNLTNSLIGA